MKTASILDGVEKLNGMTLDVMPVHTLSANRILENVNLDVNQNVNLTADQNVNQNEAHSENWEMVWSNDAFI